MLTIAVEVEAARVFMLEMPTAAAVSVEFDKALGPFAPWASRMLLKAAARTDSIKAGSVRSIAARGGGPPADARMSSAISCSRRRSVFAQAGGDCQV